MISELNTNEKQIKKIFDLRIQSCRDAKIYLNKGKIDVDEYNVACCLRNPSIETDDPLLFPVWCYVMDQDIFKIKVKNNKRIMAKNKTKQVELTKEQKLEVIRKRTGPVCEKHSPMNTKLGYVEWHDWADKKSRMGHKQKECPDCLRLFF